MTIAAAMVATALALMPAAAQAGAPAGQTPPAPAAAPAAAKGVVDVQTAIETKITELADAAAKTQESPAAADRQRASEKKSLEDMAATPSSSTAARQIAAPSAASGSGTLVDAPSFPELVGLAFDNNLVGFKASAFTLNFSLFAFRTAVEPTVIERQEEYATRVNGFLRRLGGSLTVGGKGERFDQNGNGKADAAVTADSLGDIVTFEGKYRVWGSRDRRDDDNFRKYQNAVLRDVDALENAIVEFRKRHDAELSAMSKPLDLRDPAKGSAPDGAALQAFLNRPEIAAELQPLAAQQTATLRINKAALDAIDKRMIWTVIAGGTRQHAEFGPNRVHVGVNGVVGTGRIDHTINLSWSHAEALLSNPDNSTWKAGYEASTLVFKGTLTEDGATLSFAASAERSRNVPMAKHDTIAKASLTLELPVGTNARLPLSLNYANYEDLLSDQHQLTAHVALTFDLSSVSKKKAAE